MGSVWMREEGGDKYDTQKHIFLLINVDNDKAVDLGREKEGGKD